MDNSAPILYYDAACPVCHSFVKLIRKKISVDQLKLEPISDAGLLEYKEFYIEMDDSVLVGKDAVDYISENHPEVKEYFWMLPPNYRHKAVKGSLKVANWIRKHIFRRRDCNCD